MIIAYMIGVPTLKLMGDYFAIASIGLGETIRLILENWQSFTRGARGFPGIANYTTLPVAAGFFLGMLILMRFLINGNYGRASRHAGTILSRPPCSVSKRLITGSSALPFRVLLRNSRGTDAGFLTYLQPVMFDMQKSTELTAVVVFGGLGSLADQ